MKNQESDRISKGGRLTVLSKRRDSGRETAEVAKAGPAVRKLVTFEKLNSVLGPGPGAMESDDAGGISAVGVRSSVAGSDEAAASLIRGHRGGGTTSDLIAARARQIANLEAIRICGAKLRRAIDLLS